MDTTKALAGLFALCVGCGELESANLEQPTAPQAVAEPETETFPGAELAEQPSLAAAPDEPAPTEAVVDPLRAVPTTVAVS